MSCYACRWRNATNCSRCPAGSFFGGFSTPAPDSGSIAHTGPASEPLTDSGPVALTSSNGSAAEFGSACRPSRGNGDYALSSSSLILLASAAAENGLLMRSMPGSSRRVDDGVPSISRGEQHTQLGPQASRRLGELPAGHAARESDIGEQ
jgi:hypothetical protein